MGAGARRKERLARSALILVVAGGVAVTGNSRFAHADDSTGSSSGDCVTGFSAQGNAAGVAQTLEIPYQNVAGGPYTAVELDSNPSSQARASEAYPGYAGDAVLATSGGVVPDNPTTSTAYYPVPQGGTTHDQHDDGPIAHTIAETGPREAHADSWTMNVGMADQGQSGGVTSAHSDAMYDPKLLKGSQITTGHGITVGTTHIDFMRSELQWKTDGTKEGTLATWKVSFHGVTNGTSPVYSFNGDGWSFQGSNSQPGDAQRKQFNEQEAKFSEALDQAGIGQADFLIQPGRIEVDADHIDVNGAGIYLRGAPKATRGQTDQAVSIQFGRVEEHVRIGTGPCDAVIPAPEDWKQSTPPSGPNMPKYPPDKCDRDGCHPQSFPPAPPSGPPPVPVPVPGGKQPTMAVGLNGSGSNAPWQAATTTLHEVTAGALRLLPVAPPQSVGGLAGAN